MSETERTTTPASEFEETAREVEALAAMVNTTFTELGRSLTEELTRASTEGRQTIRDMVDGMIEDLARLAAEEIVRRPLERAVSEIFDPSDAMSGDVVESILNRQARNG
jgi:hypothetical protein